MKDNLNAFILMPSTSLHYARKNPKVWAHHNDLFLKEHCCQNSQNSVQ
jgi:hypothetical protein